MTPAATSRRFLAYLERINGVPLFLGAVEGDEMQVLQKLKAKWPHAYRTQRIDLREVVGG